MNRPRPIFALLAALLFVFSGCSSTSYTNNVFTRNRSYYKVRITDLQGNLVADWISEGRVKTQKPGYTFKAVQRLSGGPYGLVTKYPQGRRVYVNGPNIVVMRCGKPEWLYHIDGF